MSRYLFCVAVLTVCASASAQNTCYTNSAGTTICSTAGGVVHGNTNSVGNSVYRDARGKQLDLGSDQFGNASITVDGVGEVGWSQSAIAEKRDPQWTKSAPALVPPRQSTPTPLFPGKGRVD